MSKKAVDVVLLPDEAMTNEAIEANVELVRKLGGKISLNKEDCLPHISLAMGCVDEKDIIPVERILQTIVKELSLSKLKVLRVQVSENSAGEKISAFEVEKTEELQSLHEMISERLEQYLSSVVTAGDIYDDEVTETTLSWIKNYREKSSFAEFSPHITIGCGELSDLPSFPIKFTASRLALCHLGDLCTCRRVLASVEL